MANLSLPSRIERLRLRTDKLGKKLRKAVLRQPRNQKLKAMLEMNERLGQTARKRLREMGARS